MSSKTNSHLVFVYGTLKSGYGNNRLLLTSKFIGNCRTTSPWMLDADGGIPFLHKIRDGKHVIGELWEVDDQTFANLDRLEGHPTFYERDKISVDLIDSSPVWSRIVWAYFINASGYSDEFKPAASWPSKAYQDRYTERGLTKCY